MSRVAMSSAWEWIRAHGDEPTLGSAERLVLVALADRLNATTGRLCPRVATLAEDTGLSARTARRALRALEALGVVASAPAYRETGAQMGSSYELRLPSHGADAPRPHSPGGADTQSGGGGHSDRGGADTVSPLEPGKIEPGKRNQPPNPPVGGADRTDADLRVNGTDTDDGSGVLFPGTKNGPTRPSPADRPIRDPHPRPGPEALHLAEVLRELRPSIRRPVEADAGWFEHLITSGPATANDNRRPDRANRPSPELVERFLRCLWGPTARYTVAFAAEGGHWAWHRYLTDAQKIWRLWASATGQIAAILEEEGSREGGGWTR